MFSHNGANRPESNVMFRNSASGTKLLSTNALLTEKLTSSWRSVGRINEVALLRDRLALWWVTVSLCGYIVSVYNHPPRPTQPPTLSGMGKLLYTLLVIWSKLWHTVLVMWCLWVMVLGNVQRLDWHHALCHFCNRGLYYYFYYYYYYRSFFKLNSESTKSLSVAIHQV